MIHLRRRELLLVGASASFVSPVLATDPIKLVVPYPAGGPADIVGRTFARYFAEESGRPVVIDNRAGASGSIGANAVAKALPDGTMLLFNPSIHVILPSLQDKLPYNAISDFTHLGVTVGVPLLLVVNNNVPAQTVRELVQYAKRQPAGLFYATSSQGSSSHLAGEQFKLETGIKLGQVPYKGSAPAIADLIGGQVQMMFDSLPSILPFVKSGRLRALAVTTPARSPLVPDVPTMEEAGFAGFRHTNWYGVWGPPGLTSDVTATLVRDIQKTLSRPDLRRRMIELGAEQIDGVVGEKFKEFAISEMARYARLIKETGVKLD
jgi:tripartite-type tricarboxylate transporter receptor subunit TctC